MQGTNIIDESQDQDTTDLHKCVSYIHDLLSPEHPNVSQALQHSSGNYLVFFHSLPVCAGLHLLNFIT